MNMIAQHSATDGQIAHGVQRTVIGLLRQAKVGISDDAENAKRCIDAAANLLAAEDAVPAVGCAGGLAQWQVRRVTSMIEADISARLTNAELAKATRLSTNHFARAFRKSFACTPHKYVLQRRIVRAKVLMSSSDDVLSQIALDCGFADQAHFCTVFRTIQGETPNVWRRRFTTPRDGHLVQGAAVRQI